MNDWTGGYSRAADLAYTYGYYSELNPMRARLALLQAGLVPPKVATACELGYGQGISTNIHAAASSVKWYGTDFNPAQAAFGRDVGAASGAAIELSDQSFAEFASADLPDFDFIGLHGIYSWISDENRRVITDFVRRKLKLGGVLYISYNTMPGWAAFAPLRQLLAEHSEMIGAEGHGILSRVQGALQFSEQLLETNPSYLRANPQVADRLKRLQTQNPHYLAHEYFNVHWNPMHFANMVDWLAPAKMSYACSANFIDHIDTANLTTAQMEFLAKIHNKEFKESVRDFMVNQQFRRDYWIKGARTLTALERSEALRSERFVLAQHRPDVTLDIPGAVGKVTGTAAIYEPILDLMSDHKIRSLGEMEQELKPKNIAFNHLLEVTMILVGKGAFAPAQDDAVIKSARPRTDALNKFLAGKARGSNDISFQASPVTGGGISVNRFGQLWIVALNEGKKTPDELASYVWDILRRQSQRLLKDGKTLETAEENLADLRVQAETFLEKILPSLKALGIV